MCGSMPGCRTYQRGESRWSPVRTPVTIRWLPAAAVRNVQVRPRGRHSTEGYAQTYVRGNRRLRSTQRSCLPRKTTRNSSIEMSSKTTAASINYEIGSCHVGGSVGTEKEDC